MKTLSVLLTLCEENSSVTGRFLLQRASNADLWSFFCYWFEQTVEQTVDLLAIGGTILLIWYQCNDFDNFIIEPVCLKDICKIFRAKLQLWEHSDAKYSIPHKRLIFYFHFANSHAEIQLSYLSTLEQSKLLSCNIEGMRKPTTTPRPNHNKRVNDVYFSANIVYLFGVTCVTLHLVL